MAPRIPTVENPSGPTSQRDQVPPQQQNTTVSPGSGTTTVVPGRVTVMDGGHSTSTPTYTGTFAYPGGDGTYGSPRPTAAYETTLIDSYNLPSSVANPYVDEGYRDYLDQVAVALGTSNSTGSALWQKAIDASQAAAANGQQISPYDIIDRWVADANSNGSNPPGGGPRGPGGSGSGSAGGTSTQVSMMSRADVNVLADSIAMEMLGRGVSQDELARIMKRVRRQERNRPRVVTTDGAGNTVVREGATQASREDVVQRVLAENPEYGAYQKATTLMDWFNAALQERLSA